MKKIIDGLEIEFDEAKASDWHMFNILRKSDGANQYEQVSLLFEAIEYMTDQTEQSIVAHLGGDEAQVADVIKFTAKVIEEATSKN